MKKSSYNIFVPCERMVIGFNTYRNMYIAISKNAYSAYNEESLDNFTRKFPNCYKNMQETGFLIEDDFDELASIRLRNKIECFASRKFQLMVFPTQDCNLKCWYCYETHRQNTKMTPEVMERIYLYVRSLIENNSFDSFQMSFFGGEPLLYFDEIVFPLASRIKNLIESAGKQFVSFFVTNAYKKGEIRNCPGMSNCYGSIDDNTLQLDSILNSSEFKKYWFLTKDMVEEYQDCEFRYACLDCRCFLRKSENIYSKPLKCQYTP